MEKTLAELQAAAAAEEWKGSIHQWARLAGRQGKSWYEPRLTELAAEGYPATAALIHRMIEGR